MSCPPHVGPKFPDNKKYRIYMNQMSMRHFRAGSVCRCRSEIFIGIVYTARHVTWHEISRQPSPYSEPPTWWRHQMETFSALLALCAGNSPVTVEFPTQRPVTRSFAVFFDLRLNQRLRKQSWGWWFDTPSRPLWRHCNEVRVFDYPVWWARPTCIKTLYWPIAF